jgi:hypothetical protein
MIWLRLIASGLIAVKFLIGARLIWFGLPLLIFGCGIVGMGGEAESLVMMRLVGLYMVILGAAIGYPFSIIRYRGAWNWIIATFATLPGAYLLLGAGVEYSRFYFALAGLAALSFWGEFFLAGRIHPTNRAT